MRKDIFDELIVVKRSGQRVSFNGYKIAIVIKKAYDNVFGEYDEKDVNKIYENVLDYLEKNYVDRKTINVEDIQDIIEREMKRVSEEVFTAFSEYRQKRAESRKVFKIKQQHKFAKAMEKIADSDILKTDANYSPTEILLKCGATVAGEYAKSYVIDNKFLRAHEEGRIFIHDIETFPLGKMSQIHPKLDAVLKDEDTLEDLYSHLVGLKSEIAGEINIPKIDTLLEKWAIKRFKEYLRERLISYLSLNGFNEYINVKKIEGQIDKFHDIVVDVEEFDVVIASTVVKNIFQTAIDDALRILEELIEKRLVNLFDRLNRIKDTYGFSIGFGSNKSVAGKIVNEVILRYLESDVDTTKLHFILNVVKIDDAVLERVEELLVKGRELSISFAFEDESVDYFENGIRIYENYNDDECSSLGRLVVATTSINMTRLALECMGSKDSLFMTKFDEILELVKNELLMTFEFIGNKNKDNYNYLFTGNITGDERLLPGQKVRKVIKNSNLNVGLSGLLEAVTIMREDEDERYEFLIEILKYANKKVDEFSKSTKLNFMICESCEEEVRKEFIAFDKAIYGVQKDQKNKNKYDLVSNLKSIREDYDKLSKIGLFFKGGNTIERSLQKNASISKVHKVIDSYYKSGIKFVRFKNKEKVMK